MYFLHQILFTEHFLLRRTSHKGFVFIEMNELYQIKCRSIIMQKLKREVNYFFWRPGQKTSPTSRFFRLNEYFCPKTLIKNFATIWKRLSNVSTNIISLKCLLRTLQQSEIDFQTSRWIFWSKMHIKTLQQSEVVFQMSQKILVFVRKRLLRLCNNLK